MNISKRLTALLICLMSITKRISALFICFIIIFLNAYTSYAAINDDILWQPLNSDHQLVEAFQYYCKSRDLTIEGSVADAVTTATTGTFNGLCNKLGIDITALQSEIKYSTDQYGGLQFLFTSNGITAYNRIFSQFLQDNELSVGDSVNDKIIDSGTYYTGYDNYTSKLYYFSQRWNSTFNTTNYCTAEGSFYKYPVSFYTSGGSNASIEVTQNYAINLNYDYLSDEGAIGGYTGRCTVYKMYYRGNYQGDVYAQLSSDTKGLILYKIGSNDTQISVAWYETHVNRLGEKIYRLWHIYSFNPNSNNLHNANVYITTNNTVINNNNYEGDTVINNAGDVINEGDVNEGDTIIYNPYPDNPNYDPNDPSSGTTTGPSSGNGNGGNNGGSGDGSDGTINFPNFNFDLPEINWSLGDLSHKFPFSIPFDLVSLVTVLDAPAEAPRFEGTVDFGFTTWDYDIDLESFDTVAAVCRTTELVMFIFGLILITRNIIKG